MNADGTNVQQLTDNDHYDENPVWSPDGTRIAFESDRDGGWEIFVMNADGTNVVTTNQRGMNPVWR
jgi:Tol biopolymer transport system component